MSCMLNLYIFFFIKIEKQIYMYIYISVISVELMVNDIRQRYIVMSSVLSDYKFTMQKTIKSFQYISF